MFSCSWDDYLNGDNCKHILKVSSFLGIWDPARTSLYQIFVMHLAQVHSLILKKVRLTWGTVVQMMRYRAIPKALLTLPTTTGSTLLLQWR